MGNILPTVDPGPVLDGTYHGLHMLPEIGNQPKPFMVAFDYLRDNTLDDVTTT